MIFIRPFWLVCVIGFASSLIVAPPPRALAQQPQDIRVRGTIEAIEGPLLVIKGADGTEYQVKPAADVVVSGMIKISLADVKVGSYIAVSAMPQSDGSQKAFTINVFPESARGAGEGFRPYDARPNSTMTNATVAESVSGNDGQTLVVKYKDGEKKVIVPPDIPIVTTLPGDKSELKAGAKVNIFRAVKQPDGTFEAARITVGRDGLTPPM